MNKGWKKWIKISKIVAGFQATIFLTIFYYLFIVPLGIFLQVFFKNVLKGHGYHFRRNTYWIKRKSIKQDLSYAQEQ